MVHKIIRKVSVTPHVFTFKKSSKPENILKQKNIYKLNFSTQNLNKCQYRDVVMATSPSRQTLII